LLIYHLLEDVPDSKYEYFQALAKSNSEQTYNSALDLQKAAQAREQKLEQL